MYHQLPYIEPAPEAARARALAAAALRAAGAALDRLAERLAVRHPAPGVEAGVPMVEFHAEAGAPEGALYVDGKFVGWLEGVKRL